MVDIQEEKWVMQTARLISLVVCLAALPTWAQDAPPAAADKNKVKYSPYPGQDFPNRVFFGDTHLHTSYSTDAGMVGCTLGPEDAYRFALGETVVSSRRRTAGPTVRSSTTSGRWQATTRAPT